MRDLTSRRSEGEARARNSSHEPQITGSASSVVAVTSSSHSPSAVLTWARRVEPVRRMIPAHSVGSLVPFQLPGGCVHSVFRNACNIELIDGSLLTLLTLKPGNLPHGIRCTVPVAEGFHAYLRPGQAVVAEQTLLCFPAAELSVDVSSATRWHGTLGDCPIDTDSACTIEALSTIRASLCDVAPGSGIASLLLNDSPPHDRMALAMRARLLVTLPLLALATEHQDCVKASFALERLVGLGPGLTPSGDDFIVGYLAALRARCIRERRIEHLLQGLIGPVRLLAKRAHAISRQFLLNAAAGEFSEPLVRIVRAISRQQDVVGHAAAAALIGHTSGTDSMMGLLFGFCPALVLGSAAHKKLKGTEQSPLVSPTSNHLQSARWPH
jgi:hypothetical protein